MTRSRKRLLALFAALPLVLLGTSVVYQWGMVYFEGQHRNLWEALEWASETLTTTGYGKDADWKHPAMVLFVISLQWLGVLLVYLVVPIFLLPFLEERLEPRLPRKAPRLKDHVVIYRYGPAVESLLVQLKRSNVPYLLLDEDNPHTHLLHNKGHRVVVFLEESEALTVASLETARALVVNGRDDENAAVILEARQRGFTREIISMAEEPFHRMPLVLAGADAVFTPRHILAAALAMHASDRFGPRLVGVQRLGDKLEVAEVRIQASSELAGKRLAEAQVATQTGATVIGQWVNGRLATDITGHTLLEPNSILITVGNHAAAEAIATLAGGTALNARTGPFVIAGFGEVGFKVAQILRDAEEEVRIVEREDSPGVDVVGNILENSTLAAANLKQARAVILALNTDDCTLFATVIIKDLIPDLPVIARVNQAKNVERIRQAGADFVLSLSHVSGQMLARRLLGEEAIIIDESLKVIKVNCKGLAGKSLLELKIRERTGCSVVAVEREKEVFVSFELGFRFQGEDTVYVCGSAEAARKFLKRFPNTEHQTL